MTSMKVTEIPVAPHVVELVEEMAHKEGFKSLKFCNYHKVELHPANWIAGVDCEGDQDDNNDNEDDKEEDEDCEHADEDLNEDEDDIDDEDDYD